MKFEVIKLRVQRSEQLLEGRLQQTRDSAQSFKRQWRDAWTPGRIVLAGLLSGFIMGRSDPARSLRKVGEIGGGDLLQALTSVTGIVASLQAAYAALTAKDAAETAGDAADTAHDAATGAEAAAVSTAGSTGADAARAATDNAQAMPRSDRNRPDPVWTTQPPVAAEAATDISEH